MRTAKAAASAKLASQEDRAQRLTRLRDAASAVASRGDGRSAAHCTSKLYLRVQVDRHLFDCMLYLLCQLFKCCDTRHMVLQLLE